MKKIKVALIALLFPCLAFAQVFNTASTLSPGKFSVGINPMVYNENFGLFLHGGVGIKSGIDLGVRYGFMEYDDYFGADIEWSLLAGKPSLSLVTGAHKFHDTGLDLGLNLSFPITSGVQMYTGLDMDIIFGEDYRGENQTYTPVWLPIGVEIPLKSNISFMFEAEIPLNNEPYGEEIFGGGLAIYF
jgi:hypothetical protein